MTWWRSLWDGAFSIASFFIAFLMGVSLANIITGIPLGPDREYAGTTLGLVTPYTVLVGVTTVALFMMHGAIYGVMKTEEALHARLRSWVNNCIIIIFFIIIICYATTTMATLIYYPRMVRQFTETPLLFFVAWVNMLAIANIHREISKGKEFRAFLSSCAAISALLLLFGIGIFPNLVYSNPHPEHSLTVYNAASSQKSLTIMFTIACLCMPVDLAYTLCIYWVFRGKVKLDEMS